MTQNGKRRSGSDPVAIQAQIERFLSTCKDPVLVEPGEPVIALRLGAFSLQPRAPGCILEVWGDNGGLVRRIVDTGPAETGRLRLKARTFGAGEIALDILDRAAKGGGRRVGVLDGMGRFAKFLARALAREFPQHRVEGLTSSPDLHRSLSSSYVRGALWKGTDSWALLAAPPEASAEACDGILTYGLIWLDELRRRKRARSLSGLRLFLPEGRAGTTLQRLPWLETALVRCELWELARNGEVRPREARDAPPLDVELPVHQAAYLPQGWMREQSELLASRRGVRWRARPDGLISFEVGGLSFVRAGPRGLTYGLESDLPATPATFSRALALAEELLRFRSPDARDRAHRLYLQRPEAWLAEQVRQNPAALAAALLPEPLYAGVPAVLGRERGVLDLLGVDARGRLVIVELKANEDIHLPLQALDYWIRVRMLGAEGAFERKGYFAGLSPSPLPPRMILAAPALQYHPQTDAVVRYLSKEISIERIGLGSDWRERLRVEFRMT